MSSITTINTTYGLVKNIYYPFILNLNLSIYLRISEKIPYFKARSIRGTSRSLFGALAISLIYLLAELFRKRQELISDYGVVEYWTFGPGAMLCCAVYIVIPYDISRANQFILKVHKHNPTNFPTIFIWIGIYTGSIVGFLFAENPNINQSYIWIIPPISLVLPNFGITGSYDGHPVGAEYNITLSDEWALFRKLSKSMLSWLLQIWPLSSRYVNGPKIPGNYFSRSISSAWKIRVCIL